MTGLLHDKLVIELKKIASKRSFERRLYLQEKMYCTRFEVIGNTVPQQRYLFKSMMDLSVYSRENTLEWKKLWDSASYFEVLSFPLFYLQNIQDQSVYPKLWPQIKKMVPKIENWGHSDTLSSVLARIYEAHPALMNSELEKWNKSSKPWLQRLSLTSLYYYVRQRKSYPSFRRTKSFIERHLNSDHYYVQKAVGWTLREASQVYVPETQKFLEENSRNLSSYAFSAATEKIQASFKKKLKKLRATDK